MRVSPPDASEPAPAPRPPPLIAWNFRKAGGWLTLVCLLGIASWQGYRGYERWRERHLAERALRYLESGDYRSAVLTARQVIQLNQANLTAAMVLAEISDRAEAPEAIYWRGRVAELAPSAKHLFAWAATALRARELSVADIALGQVPPADRQTPRFHELAGALAAASGHLILAEVHFARLFQLEPTNHLAELNLASVRLRSGRPEGVQRALETLEDLRAHPATRKEAVRALLAEARHRKDLGKMSALAGELVRVPPVEFQDHLEYLEVLQATDPGAFESQLAAVQQAVREQPRHLFRMLSWMNAQGLAVRALDWVRQPGVATDAAAVPAAVAESYVLLERWPELRAHASGRDWGEFEFLRHAYRARALRELELLSESRAEWRQAADAAVGRPERQLGLATLANRWSWTTEAEQVWWKIVDSPGTTGARRAALKGLYRLYSASGETRKLHRLSERLVRIDPEDLIARNNLAHLGLLLRQETGAAHRMAKEIYEKFPREPGFAATYAFSLQLQGKPDQAFEVLSIFPASEFQSPAMAGYKGVILAAQGKRSEARVLLELGLNSTSLLPEERALMTEALERSR